jgi:hypothetical protein
MAPIFYGSISWKLTSSAGQGSSRTQQKPPYKASTMAFPSTVRAEKQRSQKDRQRANPNNAEKLNTTPAPAAMSSFVTKMVGGVRKND